MFELDKYSRLAQELLEEFSIELIEQYMDDDIRERIHLEIAPCTEFEFVKRYIKEHYEKFGEEFTVN